MVFLCHREFVDFGRVIDGVLDGNDSLGNAPGIDVVGGRHLTFSEYDFGAIQPFRVRKRTLDRSG